jgi:hypothetical protein
MVAAAVVVPRIPKRKVAQIRSGRRPYSNGRLRKKTRKQRSSAMPPSAAASAVRQGCVRSGDGRCQARISGAATTMPNASPRNQVIQE